MQLSLYLRDGGDIGDHHKKEMKLWFMGTGDGKGKLLEMLLGSPESQATLTKIVT